MNQAFFLSKFFIRNVISSGRVVVLVIGFSINTSTDDIKGQYSCHGSTYPKSIKTKRKKKSSASFNNS